MDIVFERGNKERPKGHALIYFTSTYNHKEVWASYLVILPITVDVSKYVPPFLLNQLGEVGPRDMSAFAFPPAPEKLGSHTLLRETAEIRDDDVLYGGTVNPADVSSVMLAINDAVQQYAQTYASVARGMVKESPESEEGSSDVGVNEVLYDLMSDTDKLGELTKLVGKLRFAVESSESKLVRDTEEDIKLLATRLPETHQISRLVQAAKYSGSLGARLADLYLQRCYHLAHESYGQLGTIEAEIEDLQQQV